MTRPFHIVIDDRDVLDALARLRGQLDDMTPMMADIAMALESETEHRFEQEGPGWPRLSERTILDRIKAGKWPGKMLQRSAGGLAPSIESDHGPDYAQIGTANVYGAIHQFGGQAGRERKVTIPARPYLPIDAAGQLTSEARETILEILAEHLGEA
jgi:phage virion morphogenesis protein